MGYDFDHDCLSRYVADTCMDQINSYNTNGHSQIEGGCNVGFYHFCAPLRLWYTTCWNHIFSIMAYLWSQQTLRVMVFLFFMN